MRFGGIFLALLMLAGCAGTPSTTSAGTAPTTTTQTTPDPALIESRILRAQLTDDTVTPLGYTLTSGPEQKNYRIVLCKTQLPTDGAQSATKTATRWANQAASSTLIQYTISYRRVAAAAETVELGRTGLDCGTFEIEDSAYTAAQELAIPALGADAQFALCYGRDALVECTLLLSKGDLFTMITYIGADRQRAATDLEAAGRAVLPLLRP
ncbi:hypothetical protein ACQPZF_17595 [Actinosynnema sp. CS-041913]|uniref:hypothetical protein n=1 Tax=Actinosynnema sp. CS-041913 TaxID=3239917 RepID=UPI003D91468A